MYLLSRWLAQLTCLLSPFFRWRLLPCTVQLSILNLAQAAKLRILLDRQDTGGVARLVKPAVLKPLLIDSQFRYFFGYSPSYTIMIIYNAYIYTVHICGGYLKWGYPSIIHVHRIFHKINHPASGNLHLWKASYRGLS